MSSAASTTARHRRNCPCCLTFGTASVLGDPGPSVVGGITLPVDARVHPDDVALAEEPVGGDRRIGEVAVQRSTVRARGSGPSPARSGRCCWPRRPVRRPGAGTPRSSRSGGLRAAGSASASIIASSLSSCELTDAGHFVRCLGELRGADHIGTHRPSRGPAGPAASRCVWSSIPMRAPGTEVVGERPRRTASMPSSRSGNSGACRWSSGRSAGSPSA